MQTTSLPIQLNPNAQAPSQRNGNAAAGDGAQFGAMLSNELELRQPAPAPAPPAPKAETPKPRPADKPAQPDDAAEAQQAAKPEDAGKPAAADKAADAKDTDKADAEDASDEQPAEAGDPASAMLALMASLQQPAEDAKPDAAAGAASQAFDALNGAGAKGKRGDSAQLAALQAAMKSVSKDGAGIATSAGKAFTETAALRNPALAAAGAGIAADDKPAAATAANDAGAKLGAALAATAGKAEAQAAAAADLGAAQALQQARETDIARAGAREPAAVAALAQAQPAVMEAVQVAAGGDRLSARVGTNAWENQVGQKVVYMVGSEEQTASLTLNPPDLGPLQVVLSVSNDQASVTFSANQEEVRQALENALPRLREMMSQSGIALGDATVNAGMPDGRQAQEQAARHAGGFGGNGRGRGESGNTVEDTSARPVTRTAVLGDRGMVDTFA
jgi:flagellar hook-length control protein FliK